MLLQAVCNLSIIRGASITDPEHALAKSEWSFKTAVETSAALAAKKVSAVELAQDVIGLMDTLRIKSAHLVGVSMGAHLAGVRSAMLMQNHGFLASVNGIVSA